MWWTQLCQQSWWRGVVHFVPKCTKEHQSTQELLCNPCTLLKFLKCAECVELWRVVSSAQHLCARLAYSLDARGSSSHQSVHSHKQLTCDTNFFSLSKLSIELLCTCETLWARQKKISALAETLCNTLLCVHLLMHMQQQTYMCNICCSLTSF